MNMTAREIDDIEFQLRIAQNNLEYFKSNYEALMKMIAELEVKLKG